MVKRSTAKGGASELAAAFASAQHGGPEAVRALEERLIAAIGHARGPAEIEALFATLEKTGDEGVFSTEAGLWPTVADALIDRGCLTLAARLCVFLPTDVVRPDRYPNLVNPTKEAFVRGVDARLPAIRAALDLATLPAAYLLAHCPSATADDARALVALARKERTGGTLATLLLATGIVKRRVGASLDDTRELAHGHVAHKNRLVALCAIALLALGGEPLGARELEILAEHVTDAAPVPAAWGWGLVHPALRSDKLAVAILTWARCANAAPIVDKLLALDLSKEKLGYAFSIAEVLARVVTDKHGDHLSPEHTVLEDLDATARRAFRAERFQPRVRVHMDECLGFGWGDLQRLIEGKEAAWRPVEVEVDGQKRRWHYFRTLASVLLGETSVAWAERTLLEKYPLADAVDLVARYTVIRERILKAHPDAAEREQALALGVISGARDRGFDLEAHAHRAAAGYPPNPELNDAKAFYSPLSHLGIVLLRSQPRPTTDTVALAGLSVATAACVEPLLSALLALAADDRTAILRVAFMGHALPAFKALADTSPRIPR
jgi:hypothetical protein